MPSTEHYHAADGDSVDVVQGRGGEVNQGRHGEWLQGNVVCWEIVPIKSFVLSSTFIKLSKFHYHWIPC